MVGDQPRQLVAAAAGRDRRRQVERQVARLERRLALVEVAQRPHLRQQHRAGAGDRQEGVGEIAAGAAGGGQHGGFGERIGAERRQRLGQAPRQVLQERAASLDVEPARLRRSEEAHAVSLEPRLRRGQRGGVADLHPVAVGDDAEEPAAALRRLPDAEQRERLVGRPRRPAAGRGSRRRSSAAAPRRARRGGSSAPDASRKKSPGVSKPSVRAFGTTIRQASIRAGSQAAATLPSASSRPSSQT